eukprot:TRINITY_DN63912_c0_g1_i1.p1 TRINITY_DN63912_c0_g1~~TRINITY_DN63912_c0_g1_i1.p1  ORF type:complete len:194 (-),score=42.51 TRINITY_DN63912_c0_g1_i1:63-644(-)
MLRSLVGSEMCIRDRPNCTDWPRNHSLAPALPRFDFSDGRIWGSRIASDVTAGASGWIYWNLILDMSGGPFQYSPKHADDGANLQQAVVHVDPQAGEFHPTGLFWYLAHFSRFVNPGMKRIEVVTNPVAPIDVPEGTEGVEAVGFVQDPDGLVVVQLMNHDMREQAVRLECSGVAAEVVLPAASITSASFYLD